MAKYHSVVIPDTATNTNNQIEASFEMARGTEEITINDELITDYEVAKVRAESIFLEQSYHIEQLHIETFHIDEINIGDICSVGAVLYKIERITDKIEGAKVKMAITMKRWI